MSKRIEVSTIINKPLEIVWDEVKIMENHVNWMQDAANIDFLSENTSGINTKMNVLTKVGPIKLNDVITVTRWEEMKSIGVIHEGIVTGEGIFFLNSVDTDSTKFEWVEELKFPFYLLQIQIQSFGIHKHLRINFLILANPLMIPSRLS